MSKIGVDLNGAHIVRMGFIVKKDEAARQVRKSLASPDAATLDYPSRTG